MKTVVIARSTQNAPPPAGSAGAGLQPFKNDRPSEEWFVLVAKRTRNNQTFRAGESCRKEKAPSPYPKRTSFRTGVAGVRVWNTE